MCETPYISIQYLTVYQNVCCNCIPSVSSWSKHVGQRSLHGLRKVLGSKLVAWHQPAWCFLSPDEDQSTDNSVSSEVDYPFLEYMYTPKNVPPMQPISRITTCPQTQCTVVSLGCDNVWKGISGHYRSDQGNLGNFQLHHYNAVSCVWCILSWKMGNILYTQCTSFNVSPEFGHWTI